jgi:flavin reductase (DIM6/NTAB) family NADH-FMN oxidoreductase RutF
VTDDKRVVPHLAAVPSDRSELSRTLLRDVMARFATGVTVITVGGQHSHGMTANAFTSVSLEPPMVLCCVVRTARMHDSIVSEGSFGVSVLGSDQESVARYFADRTRPRGLSQFDRVGWFAGQHTGVPLVAGSLAWLECELAEVYEGGDHSIFLGTVRDANYQAGDALLFFGGKFHIGMPPARSA